MKGYKIVPNASTPISKAAPPFSLHAPDNSYYVKELMNTNKEILEALTGIHKTLLRRLPIKARKQSKITKTKNITNETNKERWTFHP